MRKQTWSFIVIEHGAISQKPCRQLGKRYVLLIIILGVVVLSGFMRTTLLLSQRAGNLIVLGYQHHKQRVLKTTSLALDAELDSCYAIFRTGLYSSKVHFAQASFSFLPSIQKVAYTPEQQYNPLDALFGRAEAKFRGRSFPDTLTPKIVPNGTPAKGVVSSHFGKRTDPVFEGSQFHKGIDIATHLYDPIRATADGTVMFSGFKGLWGNLVVISHCGNYFETYYAHLSTVFVDSGDVVKKGSCLGLVGSTGKSTGPHLHYEIRYKESALNPLAYMIPSDTIAD